MGKIITRHILTTIIKGRTFQVNLRSVRPIEDRVVGWGVGAVSITCPYILIKILHKNMLNN